MTWSATREAYKLRPMADTIFTKILRGDIPCHKVYEDDRVFAFLDIGPLSFGHTLVIPKEAAATIDQLSDDTAAAIGRVLPRLCRAIKAVTGAEQLNILQNNGPMAHQAVFHVHFHIIPKPSVDRGLVMEWSSTNLDPEEGARLASALSKEIGG
jgi:histidine triad (HIT) family protein